MKIGNVTAVENALEKKFLGRNPFIKGLTINVNKIAIKNVYKSSGDKACDGSIIQEPVYSKADSTPFTKFYIGSELRKIRSLITPRGKELLLWIMDELEAGKDYVEINRKRYMKELHIKSLNTYKTAVSDLVRYGIIALTLKQDVFWINPEFLFRGSRVRKYKSNTIITLVDEEDYPDNDYLNNIRSTQKEYETLNTISGEGNADSFNEIEELS